MLLLTAATDKLQLISGAAGSLDVHVDFMDMSQADPPVVKGSTSGRQNTAITTATTTDIAAAPAASTTRNIKFLQVRNKSTTVANDVTIQFNQNATLYELHKVTLAPGEALEFAEGVGFYKLATIGGDTQYVRKGSDQTFAATSLADVTGMGFALVAGGIYEIEYDIIWQTATVTVGVGVAVNGPASPASVQGTALIVGGNPATTIGDIASAGFTAYDSGPLTTSAAVINTSYMARVNCVIENGATAGTLIPRWKSETATNTTVKAGSTGTCKRLA